MTTQPTTIMTDPYNNVTTTYLIMSDYYTITALERDQYNNIERGEC